MRPRRVVAEWLRSLADWLDYVDPAPLELPSLASLDEKLYIQLYAQQDWSTIELLGLEVELASEWRAKHFRTELYKRRQAEYQQQFANVTQQQLSLQSQMMASGTWMQAPMNELDRMMAQRTQQSMQQMQVHPGGPLGQMLTGMGGFSGRTSSLDQLGTPAYDPNYPVEEK